MAEIRQSSIVKVAAFIASVGKGNKFKKLALLEAVPGVSQADRRMRDLRSMGWVIENYKNNPTLNPDEYLLVSIGTRVDLGERPPASGRKSISGPKRRRILERDAYACQVCGTSAGEPFADDLSRRATLSIGHIVPVARGGNDDDANLRAECQRCNDEARDLSEDPPSAEEVLAWASRGSRKDKRLLYSWMAAGRRTISDQERTYIRWRQLPLSKREEVMAALARQVIEVE